MNTQKIGYYFFLILIYTFKIIPFPLLYLFSNGIYYLLYYLIGYRTSVVRKNLDYCFPEKRKKEKKEIERKFYKNLTDLILESIKGYTISEKEALKRFKMINPELLNKYYEAGKSVIMTVGHMGNWELANATVVKDFSHIPLVYYKPLSNKYIDQFIYKKRSRFGAEMLSIYKTKAHFEQKRSKPVSIYMVADQYSTSKNSKKVIFFGKETVFLRGIEFYSKKYKMPVIYVDMKKVKRGYYEASLSVLEEIPHELKENELTQKYANRLEQSIKKRPETWMWSHKRWKNKRIY